MPRKARYQDPMNRRTLLEAIRGGADRETAVRMIGGSIGAFLGWLERDSDFARDVEAAETIARSKSIAPAPKRGAKKDPTADRWERMRLEAAALGPGLFGLLLYVDGILASKGFPPISLWWRETLRRFYESGKRWLLLRVGRRGGKSSTLCRVAVVEALFAERKISPGDVGVWPIFSTDKGEARGRLTTIKAILDALGVEYTESEKDSRPRVITSDAFGHPIEFRVYPATVNGASGFTAIGATHDEEAKWTDEDTGANPAKEVLRSVRQTMKTNRGAHGFRCSSAWSEEGTHFKDIEAGDTATHFVATIGAEYIAEVKATVETLADNEESPENAEAIREYAKTLTADSANVPTWLAGPHIDPFEDRADEPDLSTWLRESMSKSGSTTAATFFDDYKLEQSVKRAPPAGLKAALADIGKAHRKLEDLALFAALDTGSKSNAFALAIVWRHTSATGVVTFGPAYLREWVPSPARPLDIDRKTIPEAARVARGMRCGDWITDSYYGTSVELRGAEHGIETHYTSNDPFTESYDPARRSINRDQVCLNGCDGSAELVRQLRKVKSQPADAGRTKMLVPTEKDDRTGSIVHGDLGVAFIRALAFAGAGEVDSGDNDIAGVPSRYAEDQDG